MSLARTLVRWSLCMAAGVSLVLPAIAADKKAEKKEAAATVPSYNGPQPMRENVDLNMYARIREEGLRHSKVMQFASALSDGIGPRLTGSPNMAKANAWTRDTLTAIGLENAHLEDWGEFGTGWAQVNTWIRMVSPDPEPLWGQAAPWSVATKGPVSGEAVLVTLTDEKDLGKYKGKLGGKIVLLGAMRPTPDLTEPLFHRYTTEELAEMETYPAETRRPGGGPPMDMRQMMAERHAADAAAGDGAEDDDGRGRGGDHHAVAGWEQWRRNGDHLRRQRGEPGAWGAGEGDGADDPECGDDDRAL